MRNMALAALVVAMAGCWHGYPCNGILSEYECDATDAAAPLQGEVVPFVWEFFGVDHPPRFPITWVLHGDYSCSKDGHPGAAFDNGYGQCKLGSTYVFAGSVVHTWVSAYDRNWLGGYKTMAHEFMHVTCLLRYGDLDEGHTRDEWGDELSAAQRAIEREFANRLP